MMSMRKSILGGIGLWLALAGVAFGYDPLAVDTNVPPQTLELTVHDATRDRDIPVKVYLPAEKGPVPVVLFSHGLGGTREGSMFLGVHWAERGYVAVFLQHPGSDDSVWRGKQLVDGAASMEKAASIQNFNLRVKDVPAVLDRLAVWNGDATSPLVGRMNLGKVGMSGHSFGAVTTEAVSGEAFMGRPVFTDKRITAAIAFSPSSPKMGTPAKAFGDVKIPWMLMTGTKDVAPIGNQDVASRLAVYDNLMVPEKYEVVLNNAEHSVFTDRALPGDKEPRNPNHHRVILALSTAFWDAYLKDDPAAMAWLNSQAPRDVMEAEDAWKLDGK